MKKLRSLLFSFLVIFSAGIYAQQVEIKTDSVKFEIEKSKKVNRRVNPSRVAVLDKRLKQVRIKVKMTPLYARKVFFDPNKFSVVSDELQSRFRPSDVFFKNFTDLWSFQRCTSKSPKKENKGELNYTPDLLDTFLDYSYKEYKNIDFKVNLGTKKKRDIHVVYFKPREINDRLMHVFVVVPIELKTAYLYYGDVKIGEVNFK